MLPLRFCRYYRHADAAFATLSMLPFSPLRVLCRYVISPLRAAMLRFTLLLPLYYSYFERRYITPCC